MAINYGIHQDGDSYVINPRLVNGDGFIGLGDEVKVHIGAGVGDDTLIAPKLQLTGGARAGNVLKSMDNQGNAKWMKDPKFCPFDKKDVFVSYTYEGLSTITESFDAGSTATLEHTPSNPSDNLRVYIGTDNNLTEEVPSEDYSLSENTLTFSPALDDHFVVVYSYSNDITVTDEQISLSTNSAALMHTVKSGTTITVADRLTGEQDRVVYVAGTDYNLSQDREYIELIADGAIIGRSNDRKFVTVDNSGEGRLESIGSTRSAFVNGFPQTATLFDYTSYTDFEEEGTLDANKSYTSNKTFLEGDDVQVHRVEMNGEEVEFSYNPETHTVTVDSASDGDTVTVYYGLMRRTENVTVNLTDGVASLTVPSFGNSYIISGSLVDADPPTRWYIPYQDYTFGGEDGHSLVLLDHPINNQVLSYNENGDPEWVNLAGLIDNPDYGPVEGKVVVNRDGRLVYQDSSATVELENLVPEDGRQDSYILAWDGTQERVVWKIDNDTWPAVRDSSTASGQFLVSTVNGGEHTAGWSDDITLATNASFSLTTSGSGEITLGSSNHIDISTDGNGNTAGIDIVASNSNDTTGSSVGVKAYNDVTMETVSGNIEMTSGHSVTIETSDSDNADAGNIIIQAGDSTVGYGGNITIKSGSGDTHDGKLLLDTSTLQIQGLAGMAANMVLYIQSVDPSTGVATLGVTTVDSLVMTSGH